MRQRYSCFLNSLIILTILIPGICLAGAFDPIAVNARAWGMGSAYTAVAEDPTAVYWNPAGLAGVRRPAAAITHLDIQTLGLLSYDQIAYAQPFVFNNTIGVSWSRMGTTNQVAFLDYAEHTIILSYQQSVWDALSLGLNMKVFQVQYDKAAGGFGIDIGARYTFLPKLVIALMAENLNYPEIYWITGAYDRLPINLRLGLAGYIDKHTILALDGDRLLDNNPQVHFGVERWFFNHVLALRAGTIYLSMENHFSISGGLGVKILFMELSYAYASHLDLDGNHILSLNWEF